MIAKDSKSFYEVSKRIMSDATNNTNQANFNIQEIEKLVEDLTNNASSALERTVVRFLHMLLSAYKDMQIERDNLVTKLENAMKSATTPAAENNQQR